MKPRSNGRRAKVAEPAFTAIRAAVTARKFAQDGGFPYATIVGVRPVRGGFRVVVRVAESTCYAAAVLNDGTVRTWARKRGKLIGQ